MYGSKAERTRKYFVKIFKAIFKLNIKTENNLKIVNFVDMTNENDTLHWLLTSILACDCI